MKRTIITCAAILATMLPSAAFAATANAPSDGLVGLWLLANGASTQATIGSDLAVVYDGGSGTEASGTSIQIGTEADPFLYQDNGNIQETTWGAVDITHGIAPNGGGAKVNEYTWLMDYKQDSEIGNWASLFDTTDGDAHDGGLNSDGELFTRPDGTIGVTATGYSTLSYDPSVHHRIVLSVDNGSSYQVYIDGVLYLDGTPQAIDGRFSLAPTFHLLVDNAWEGGWGHLDTVMMWDRALTQAEITGMGTFSDAGNGGFPTPLIIGDVPLVPEPSTMILFGLGLSSLVAVRRRK